MSDLNPPPTLDQQNSTALKWGSDGELSPLDLQRILGLLCEGDPVAESQINPGSQSSS
jgi:hypothetical protein